MLKLAAALCLIAASPAAARQYHIVKPLPAEVVGKLRVVAVDVAVSGEAEPAMVPHEAKAAARRSDGYAGLPFTRMFPRVMEDVTRQWGLASGRAVKLNVTIAEFGTANAGRAMLFGRSPDFMSGLVEVGDAVTGATLGLFTVKVVNRHTGWTGMLIRGGGIREKLSEEFALESARVLSGHKSKKAKANSAGNIQAR